MVKMMWTMFLNRNDGLNISAYQATYFVPFFWYKTAELQVYNNITEHLMLALSFRFNSYGHFQPQLFKIQFQGNKLLYNIDPINHPNLNLFDKALGMIDKYDNVIISPKYYSILGKAVNSLMLDLATTLSIIYKNNPQISDYQLMLEFANDEAKNKKIAVNNYVKFIQDSYLMELYAQYHRIDFAKIYSPKKAKNNSISGFVYNEVKNLDKSSDNPFRKTLRQYHDFLLEPINSRKVIDWFKQYNANYKSVVSIKEWWQEGDTP